MLTKKRTAMKKHLTIILALLVAFSLVGCSTSKPASTSDTSPKV